QRLHVGMALQARVDLVERLELLDGEVAALGQHGVEGDGGVTFGEDEAVALGPVGALGVDAHDLEVEGHEDVGGRERATQVAGLRLVDGLDDQAARLHGDALQLLYACLVAPCRHHASSPHTCSDSCHTYMILRDAQTRDVRIGHAGRYSY